MAGYICDLVARPPHFIVEVDDDSHAQQQAYDTTRTIALEAAGYRVVRFSNADIVANLEGVLHAVGEALAALPSPRPSREREGG